jgi:nucleoside-diphosphate-sugar epimerase
MTYLVTGGMGCIGAWVLRRLRQRGEQVVSFDLSDDRKRLDLLMRRDHFFPEVVGKILGAIV